MRAKHVVKLIEELALRIGIDAFLRLCLGLMTGAEREGYVEDLRFLTEHAWEPGDFTFDRSKWPDYWVRSWGARGLLHVWDERPSSAVVAGLEDEHWRPAEMCLKVVARHEVAGADEGVALLLKHPLPRLRIQALRAMAVVGDTEHLEAVLAAQSDERADVRRQARSSAEAMRLRPDHA